MENYFTIKCNSLFLYKCRKILLSIVYFMKKIGIFLENQSLNSITVIVGF